MKDLTGIAVGASPVQRELKIRTGALALRETGTVDGFQIRYRTRVQFPTDPLKQFVR